MTSPTMPETAPTTSDHIKANVKAVEDTIAAFAGHAGLPRRTPKLIAVSKRQNAGRIDAALDAGIRCFGENIVQEALERWQDRRTAYPDLELHLIGHLQSNKAKDAVALFDVIQTLDSIKLANRLQKAMADAQKSIPLYIQVNTGEEPQKAGVTPSKLDELIEHARHIGLNIIGLMVIPPQDGDTALHFALLKKLAAKHKLDRLSMGMSDTYALAACMGATDIRVGTQIFGDRDV